MSDPPLSDDDGHAKEVTGIHDVPHALRSWAESQSRKVAETQTKVRKIEKHFEPKGMVFELHSDWSAIIKSFNFWIKVGPILGALVVAGIGALMWIIHASVVPPAPAPPSAQDIAREVVKQAQQK